MPADPVTHGVSFTKIVAACSAFVSVAFDIPFGVFVSGFAGAFLAVAVNNSDQPEAADFKQALQEFLHNSGMIVAGGLLAAVLTPATREVFTLAMQWHINDLILKPIGVMFGFVPWHHATRRWLISQATSMVGLWTGKKDAEQ